MDSKGAYLGVTFNPNHDLLQTKINRVGKKP